MAIFDTKPTIDKPLGTNVTTDKPAVLATPNKVHIQERLNKALDSREPRNRSSDLVPLTQDYEDLRKMFRKLIEVSKVYHDSLGRACNARMESMEVLNKMLKDTPLESVATSDMDVQNHLVNKHREMSQRYKQDIIDYIVQLDNAIETRVDTEQKQVHELHQRLVHYETKIEKLRKTVRTKLSKSNTEVPKRKAEKLQRNEEKLSRAWKLHEAKASRICDLLEEVTANGWKDLCNLIGNIFEFEKDYNEENAKITRELPTLKMQLEKIYAEYRDKSNASARSIPVALQTKEAKEVILKNEVHYNDEISLSSSSSFSSSDEGADELNDEGDYKGNDEYNYKVNDSDAGTHKIDNAGDYKRNNEDTYKGNDEGAYKGNDEGASNANDLVAYKIDVVDANDLKIDNAGADTYKVNDAGTYKINDAGAHEVTDAGVDTGATTEGRKKGGFFGF